MIILTFATGSRVKYMAVYDWHFGVPDSIVGGHERYTARVSTRE